MKNFYFSFVLFLSFCWPNNDAFGQPSVIETLQNLMPSLVDITAENLQAAKQPHASAAIDKASGRLVILRNVKAAYYKRQGAGVVIDPSGIIMTNFHIIKFAGHIQIVLSDKTKLEAKVLRVFPENDLALLSVSPPYPLIPVEFADSKTLNLRDEVFTVGSSELLDQTISQGKIIGLGSHRTQKNTDTDATDMFQINMNLYKGDSGGPLFDSKGRFIGLIAAGQIATDRSTFVIPSNKIHKCYTDYLASIQKN